MLSQSKYVEAIPLLQRATELDPNLWLAGAVLNTGGGNWEWSQEYSNKALALRDRVSLYERSGSRSFSKSKAEAIALWPAAEPESSSSSEPFQKTCAGW